MSFKSTAIYCLKIWFSILIPVILIVPALEGFNLYLRVLIPTVVMASIFTTPAIITLFVVLRFFTKKESIYGNLQKITILGGLAGFYISKSCFYIYWSLDMTRKSYLSFMLDIHKSPAYLLYVLLTVGSCYYWSFREKRNW